jgi:hypothetical protein
MERASFTVTYEGKVRVCFYQGMCRSRLWKWASLSIGELGVGSFTRYFERRMKEGSGNGTSLCLWKF